MRAKRADTGRKEGRPVGDRLYDSARKKTSHIANVFGDRDIRGVEYDDAQNKKIVKYATVTTQPCVVHFAGLGKFSLPKLLLRTNLAESNWMPWN